MRGERAGIVALLLTATLGASLEAQYPGPRSDGGLAGVPGGPAPAVRPPNFGAGSPPPPIDGVVVATVPPAPRFRGLAGLFYYFVDPTGELTFDDVRAPAFAGQFQLSKRDHVNLGFTRSALWLRIDLQRVQSIPESWMLTFDYPLLDHIDVYDASRPGADPVARLGDRQPFARRIVPHRSFGIPLGTDFYRLRLYVRIETTSSMQARPGLVSGRDLFLDSVREEMYFGVAYGVILLMAVYNLFLFFALRDRTYLLYVAATLSAEVFLMCLNGHAFQYLWPRWPRLANEANPFLASTWLLASAGFARLFLEPARHSPPVARVVNGFIVLGAVSTVLAIFLPYQPAMMFAAGGATLNGLALLVCGAVVWARGLRAARFFTIAWVGVALGTFNVALSRFGLIPDNDYTRNGALMGAVFEVVLLSFALSDKYRLMQAELEGYSRGLESMVEERTQELAEANASLQKLATIDPLTGVSNRRTLDEGLVKEVSRHHRIGLPLSLAVVDIDHFKTVNDRHGHLVGDEWLRLVATAISSIAHRSADLVSRYGGEEFAVVLPHTDADGARAIAERIRHAVRGIPPPIAGGAGVTVSVGVCTRVPTGGAEALQMLDLADRALYEAKRGGRDRVVTAREDA